MRARGQFHMGLRGRVVSRSDTKRSSHCWLLVEQLLSSVPRILPLAIYTTQQGLFGSRLASLSRSIIVNLFTTLTEVFAVLQVLDNCCRYRVPRQQLGMSNLGSLPADSEKCKKEACKIQACLTRTGFDMQRCQGEVDKLKECCKGVEHVSTHCSMVSDQT